MCPSSGIQDPCSRMIQYMMYVGRKKKELVVVKSKKDTWVRVRDQGTKMSHWEVSSKRLFSLLASRISGGAAREGESIKHGECLKRCTRFSSWQSWPSYPRRFFRRSQGFACSLLDVKRLLYISSLLGMIRLTKSTVLSQVTCLHSYL